MYERSYILHNRHSKLGEEDEMLQKCTVCDYTQTSMLLLQKPDVKRYCFDWMLNTPTATCPELGQKCQTILVAMKSSDSIGSPVYADIYIDSVSVA